ncbi:MAG TPA: N-acetylmuramoyl-L-alanine amidase [Caulobacteraceae bacterium]|jgi:N-acetylmuramoyl-L-alanine amidase|nr:N-acetylmuramoyl-L-alanine amidase [Caulobacteraceae bacterium]
MLRWSFHTLARAILAGLICAAGAAHAIGSGPSASAASLRLGGEATATRVVLDLSGPPGPARIEHGGAGLVLHLDAITGVGATQGTGIHLVRTWRMNSDATGLRVDLGLAGPVKVQHRFVIPPATPGGPWRYVLDLASAPPADDLAELLASSGLSAPPSPPAPSPGEPAPRPIASPRLVVLPVPDRPAPAAFALADPGPLAAGLPNFSARPLVSARPSPRPLAASAAPASAHLQPAVERVILEPRRGRRTIVIDAGHGGHDTGALGASRLEKEINLAAAMALKRRLEASGRYRVVMTRSDDTFVALEERVRIARHAHADLFISLHSDSAGADASPHGASVYTLADHAVDRVHSVLAPDDALSRAAGPRAGRGVSQILIDLSQRSTRNRSAEFAQTLIDQIGKSVDLLPRSHRDAGYFVLLAPDVPAVLLEMGFITNAADEARLADPEQRQRFMDRVADAIDDYFAPPRQLAAVGS